MRHVGTAVEVLRKRRGWSQRELAAVAGFSQQLISRFERGQLDKVTGRTLESVVVALGGRLRIEVLASGPVQVDRRHAALQEWLASELLPFGWMVQAEHSFNQYGDRGRVDILAFHSASGVLLVFEVKTRITDVQDVLGRLDIKCRLARGMARDLGWSGVTNVVPALLLADHRTNRRRIGEHPILFSRFGLRGHSARAWLRRPGSTVPTGLLIYRDPGQIRPA